MKRFLDILLFWSSSNKKSCSFQKFTSVRGEIRFRREIRAKAKSRPFECRFREVIFFISSTTDHLVFFHHLLRPSTEIPRLTETVQKYKHKSGKRYRNRNRVKMGACTSTAAGSSSAETCDNVYRIRQLDEKYRRKQLFILRLTDKQIIIMRKGRREKPEKTISVN